ncbi:UTRA domain-containing protein [Microbacterium excoecariae]|uniref:UTRA domain-containing protein n=1 Tax=Microbacterium excoecariae TaxID=2715210 RepID=UPI00140A2BA8|nr:GntR family transcriptional regulator [Microbacterium excoecariae]
MTAHKYRALADRLRAQIHRATVGAPVPSERQLAHETGVSRMTARRAIDELVREGILTREVGRGTFVARPAIQAPLQLTSFAEDMRVRGHTPTSTVLHLGEVPAEVAAAAWLGVEPGDPVVLLARVRLADGEPMAIEYSHLSADAFPGLERFDFARESLYRVLTEEYGARFDDGEQTVRATLFDAADAAHLGVAEGDAALELVRRVSSSGRPIERTVSRYRADAFELTARLAPAAGASAADGGSLRPRAARA